MIEEYLKYSVLPFAFMSGIAWINRDVVKCEEEKKPLKKAPEGCNPPEPWDPNFKGYETIEEKQRVAHTPLEEVKELLHTALRGLEKIEYQESQVLDKED